MLNFQTDYDEATGEQVLTCFLLPQMEYQAEQMGKLSKKISVVLFYFCQPIACPPFLFFKKNYLPSCLDIYTFFSVGFF